MVFPGLALPLQRAQGALGSAGVRGLGGAAAALWVHGNNDPNAVSVWGTRFYLASVRYEELFS